MAADENAKSESKAMAAIGRKVFTCPPLRDGALDCSGERPYWILVDLGECGLWGAVESCQVPGGCLVD